MQINGQVFNPRFFPATEAKEGKPAKTATFLFDLSTRKPRVQEGNTNPYWFTGCVAFGATAVRMNEYYGKEEHKGKWVSLTGQFDERVWEPELTLEKYRKRIVIDKAALESWGFKLAEGSKESATVWSTGKQIDKQILVNGFEFIGAHVAPAASAPSSSKPSTGFALAEDDVKPAEDAPAGEDPLVGVGVPAGTTDDDLPF